MEMDVNLEIQILNKYEMIRPQAMLVEGFSPDIYPAAVARFKRLMSIEKNPLVLDFLHFIQEIKSGDELGARRSLVGAKNLFAYNLDLFGDGIDPDTATTGMTALRSDLEQAGDMSQLMFARPKANLDYTTRPGYGDLSNHPLVNWCDFYAIEGSKVVRTRHPMSHRGR